MEVKHGSNLLLIKRLSTNIGQLKTKLELIPSLELPSHHHHHHHHPLTRKLPGIAAIFVITISQIRPMPDAFAFLAIPSLTPPVLVAQTYSIFARFRPYRYVSPLEHWGRVGVGGWWAVVAVGGGWGPSRRLATSIRRYRKRQISRTPHHRRPPNPPTPAQTPNFPNPPDIRYSSIPPFAPRLG